MSCLMQPISMYHTHTHNSGRSAWVGAGEECDLRRPRKVAVPMVYTGMPLACLSSFTPSICITLCCFLVVGWYDLSMDRRERVLPRRLPNTCFCSSGLSCMHITGYIHVDGILEAVQTGPQQMITSPFSFVTPFAADVQHCIDLLLLLVYISSRGNALSSSDSNTPTPRQPCWGGRDSMDV